MFTFQQAVLAFIFASPSVFDCDSCGFKFPLTHSFFFKLETNLVLHIRCPQCRAMHVVTLNLPPAPNLDATKEK